MLRLFLLLSVLAATGCGGAISAPTPTPIQPLDLDPATAELWAGWAAEAQQIAGVIAQTYGSGGLLPSQAAEQQKRAESLAEEIRSAEPSNEMVLRLAEDLDEVVGALEFGLEYAQNAGLVVINVVIPGLVEALNQLVQDATELSELVETS